MDTNQLMYSDVSVSEFHHGKKEGKTRYHVINWGGGLIARKAVCKVTFSCFYCSHWSSQEIITLLKKHFF
jgi:hypothetical protein